MGWPDGHVSGSPGAPTLTSITSTTLLCSRAPKTQPAPGQAPHPASSSSRGKASLATATPGVARAGTVPPEDMDPAVLWQCHHCCPTAQGQLHGCPQERYKMRTQGSSPLHPGHLLPPSLLFSSSICVLFFVFFFFFFFTYSVIFLHSPEGREAVGGAGRISAGRYQRRDSLLVPAGCHGRVGAPLPLAWGPSASWEGHMQVPSAWPSLAACPSPCSLPRASLQRRRGQRHSHWHGAGSGAGCARPPAGPQTAPRAVTMGRRSLWGEGFARRGGQSRGSPRAGCCAPEYPALSPIHFYSQLGNNLPYNNTGTHSTARAPSPPATTAAPCTTALSWQRRAPARGG